MSRNRAVAHPPATALREFADQPGCLGARGGNELGPHSALRPLRPLGVACDPYGDTPSGCDWSYLDDVFEVARIAGVPVHIQITPGFDSPQWLVTKIPSCDGLFDPKTAPSVAADCGKVTFTYFPEINHTAANEDGHYVLPLPWNTVYQHAWWSFLKLFAQRYNPGLGSRRFPSGRCLHRGSGECVAGNHFPDNRQQFHASDAEWTWTTRGAS